MKTKKSPQAKRASLHIQLQHVGESCTCDLHTYEEQASAGHASLKSSSIKVPQLALVRQKHLQANLTYIGSLLALDPSVLCERP